MAQLVTMLSPAYLVIAVVVLLALRRLYFELTTGAARRKMIRDHGCQPVWRYPHKGVLGNLLGLDMLQDIVASAKAGRMMERGRIRNFGSGHHTMQARVLWNTVYVTIEPENVKAMLSTQFDDFILGHRRHAVFIPVFGHGIFDTDGAAWARSRAMIRPSFTRHQIADLDMFESHVSQLINHIPRDGSPVDLQHLFFSLTMDSATEFLFGRSTNILDTGAETAAAREFVESSVAPPGSLVVFVSCR